MTNDEIEKLFRQAELEVEREEALNAPDVTSRDRSNSEMILIGFTPSGSTTEQEKMVPRSLLNSIEELKRKGVSDITGAMVGLYEIFGTRDHPKIPGTTPISESDPIYQVFLRDLKTVLNTDSKDLFGLGDYLNNASSDAKTGTVD